ncbi:TetR/AcrR family transcriptional regulator [Streptomyces sp. NPDC047065]|uniref:TetR/AcrR family transcriptional regulator n=1 Tax=Streptomyces sp. NPDC047065 TaxID=3154606 RepID=UPI0033E2FBB7
MNQDLILDAAFALVERGGSEALTLRRLGADLGANHTAVPRHFASKDETPRGLADRLIARAMEDFVPAGGWRETLETLARRMRTVCVAHPRVAVPVATRIARRGAEFHGADVVIGALRTAGFNDSDAARYYCSVVDTIPALAAYEACDANLSKAPREGDQRSWRRREHLAIPPDRYPDFAAVALGSCGRGRPVLDDPGSGVGRCRAESKQVMIRRRHGPGPQMS